MAIQRHNDRELVARAHLVLNACSSRALISAQRDELSLRVGVLLAKTDAFDLFPIDRRFPKRRLSWQRDPVAEDSVIVV